MAENSAGPKNEGGGKKGRNKSGRMVAQAPKSAPPRAGLIPPVFFARLSVGKKNRVTAQAESHPPLCVAAGAQARWGRERGATGYLFWCGRRQMAPTKVASRRSRAHDSLDCPSGHDAPRHTEGQFGLKGSLAFNSNWNFLAKPGRTAVAAISSRARAISPTPAISSSFEENHEPIF